MLTSKPAQLGCTIKQLKVDKLLVIFGPTSSGKTDLSLILADYMNDKYKIKSKIISTDSRQLYRGIDIGTTKNRKNITEKNLATSSATFTGID